MGGSNLSSKLSVSPAPTPHVCPASRQLAQILSQGGAMVSSRWAEVGQVSV